MLTCWRTLNIFMFTLGLQSLWLFTICSKCSESSCPSPSCSKLPVACAPAPWPVHSSEPPGPSLRTERPKLFFQTANSYYHPLLVNFSKFLNLIPSLDILPYYRLRAEHTSPVEHLAQVFHARALTILTLTLSSIMKAPCLFLPLVSHCLHTR